MFKSQNKYNSECARPHSTTLQIADVTKGIQTVMIPLALCISSFLVAVTKQHDQGNLQKERLPCLMGPER